MFSRLQGIVEQIAGKKILVIGDIMLDTYIFGTAERLSPEAPVPIVPAEKRIHCPGGAANVAANLEGLGAEVTLAGFVGHDQDGDWLMRGIKSSSWVFRTGVTTSKIRVIANGHHVVRIDSEECPPALDTISFAKSLEVGPRDYDWIILSDYDKGVVTNNIAMWAIRTYGNRVSVDSKKKNLKLFSGCGIITPNTKEAEQALGHTIRSNEEANMAARLLLNRFQLEAVLLTRGRDGMVLGMKNTPNVVFIPAAARAVFDVTGAGDTVIAVLSAALATGANMVDAAILSGLAAGVVVEEVGTSAIAREGLLEAIKETRRREFRPYFMGVTP